MTEWPEDSDPLRHELVDTARALDRRDLGVNAEGNVSVRCRRDASEGFLITPSGVVYERLEPDDLVFIPNSSIDADHDRTRRPSSEWRLHVAVYAVRPEFGAIVHTHSPYATALACHHRGIPAFHYMVAAAGGDDIKCTDYAMFGTQQLADLAAEALRDRSACLLAHHGVVAGGASLAQALGLAIEVEHLARTYLASRVVGEPPLLTADEMAKVVERFKTYGQPR